MGDVSRYEVLSINRALFFDDSEYIYQKMRMMVFLKLERINIWMIIDEGPYVPKKIVDGAKVAKIKSEWNDYDKRMES